MSKRTRRTKHSGLDGQIRAMMHELPEPEGLRTALEQVFDADPAAPAAEPPPCQVFNLRDYARRKLGCVHR